MNLTLDQKSALYDQVYAAAKDLLKHHNPCQIQPDGEGGMSCSRSRKHGSYWQHDPQQLCCAGCKHCGPEGCTVDALACRLSACTDNYHSADLAGWADEAIVDLMQLRASARKAGIPLIFRASKAESFEALANGQTEGWRPGYHQDRNYATQG